MYISRLCIFISFFICAFGEKVIIIGAGVSGIATASRLLDKNFTDFIILEAENRIGGRIHTFHLGRAFVDLGAQFVHGEKGNIAYTLAKDYVVHNPEINKVAVYFNGKKKEGETLTNITKQLYDELEGHIIRDDVSVGEIYLSKYKDAVLSKYKDDPEMTKYAISFLKNTQGSILSLEGAFDWFKVSVKSNYQQSEGDQTLSWNGLGYRTILDILLKNYPRRTGYNLDNQIFLRKIVNKISIENSSVQVRCEDGSSYTTDHVVFTPSLGVLKKKHKDIFVPNLISEKVRAIENVGFDGIMKILVAFDQIWWQNEKNFLFVWSDEDIIDLRKAIPYGPRTGTDHWLSWFSYIGIAPNNNNVMIGWYSGPFVEEVEKLTEDQMGKAVFYALSRHLGKDYNITEPRTVIHSKWRSNPNFRGTYSFETVQQRRNNITTPQEILSKPVSDNNGTPRILFAGEATNPTRYSTVDGAIGSGFREGDRLLRLFGVND